MPTNSNSTQVYNGNSDKGEIQIIRERPVYENKYGILYDDQVLFPSGTKGYYIRFLWKAPFSVAVLPIMEDGRIALIKVFRHALRDWILEIPKGFADQSQEANLVAEKELVEETGLRSKRIRKSMEVITDAAFTAYKMIIFIAEGCEQIEQPELEDEETIASLNTYTIPEIGQMIHSGEIKDAITLLALSSFVFENSRDVSTDKKE